MSERTKTGKSLPPINFSTFRRRFEELVAENSISWELVGFYATSGRVYPFGTDTKVISTVFEALSAPIIKEIAGEFGYVVETAEQTVYPDFTLSPTDEATPTVHRIAVDIKTTYRKFNARGQVKPFRYTLGSYTSFLRSPGATKNIRYPYSEYSDHWVIGFLYTRRLIEETEMYYESNEQRVIPCPYQDVEFFIQEKYKIVGLTPASGNTANIGSFPTADINDLRLGIGPFANTEKDVCDRYWRNYGRSAQERSYNSIEDFLAWEGRSRDRDA